MSPMPSKRPQTWMLRKWYLTEKRSIREIAELSGAHPKTVWEWLGQVRIPTRDQHAAQERYRRRPPDEEMRRLYSVAGEGLTIDEIARRYDRSPSTVRVWLRKAGARKYPEGSPPTP